VMKGAGMREALTVKTIDRIANLFKMRERAVKIGGSGDRLEGLAISPVKGRNLVIKAA